MPLMATFWVYEVAKSLDKNFTNESHSLFLLLPCSSISPEEIVWETTSLCETSNKVISVKWTCSIMHLVDISTGIYMSIEITEAQSGLTRNLADVPYTIHVIFLCLCAYPRRVSISFPKCVREQEANHFPGCFNGVFDDWFWYLYQKKLMFCQWTNPYPNHKWQEI